MKILSNHAYRKLVNLCDSLSTKLYNEKTTTSLLLHENIELQKRVQELEKKLNRNTKRDAKGLFIQNTPTLAKISATLDSDRKAVVKTNGSHLDVLILSCEIKKSVV